MAARARAERMLFACRDAGDLRARETLAERFLPLARSLARRYENSSEPIDDLIQVASLALVKAIDRFDPARGTAFSSFAVPTIVGELKRHLRDRTWVVRPPRRLQELTLRVEHATRQLSQQLDRAPTICELAAELGSEEEQILEAWHALGGRNAISLQAPAGQQDEQITLQDTLGSSDEDIELAEPRIMLSRLMAGMPPPSREVLHLRFEKDMTQKQIGELLGVSQMQVSRRIRDALAQLRVIADGHRQLAEDYRNTQRALNAGAQHAARDSAGAILARQPQPGQARIVL